MPDWNRDTIAPADSKGLPLRRLINAIAIVVAIGLAGDFCYALLDYDPNGAGILSNLRPEFLLLSFVLVFIPTLTHAARLRLWSRVFGCDLPWRRALTAVFCNDIGSALTPTAVGGGYAKLYYLYRSGLTPPQATLTMMLGSLEDSVFVVLIVGISIYGTSGELSPALSEALGDLSTRLPLLAGILLGLAVLLLLVRRLFSRRGADAARSNQPSGSRFERLRDRFRRFRREFKHSVGFAWRHGRATLAVNTLLSLIGWICRYGSINAVLLGFGLPIDPILFLVLNWGAFTVTNFVATPGGVGGAEAAFVVLFTPFVPVGMISLVTLAWRFLTFYLLLIVGAGFIGIRGTGLDSQPSVTTTDITPTQQPLTRPTGTLASGADPM
ncbi:flippase-like domain-containing protein [candidate division GN15 bacterium]|nr:flippase-like domain-containing protein [candidate division GN15 bacterium]